MNDLASKIIGTAATTATPSAEAAPKKPSPGARKAGVATSKPKPSPAKKAPKAPPKGAPRAKPSRPEKPAKPKGPREGSISAKLVAMLKRPDGATLKELMKASGWQAHSVRGFLSAAVAKRMGMKVASEKSKDGERAYAVKG